MTKAKVSERALGVVKLWNAVFDWGKDNAISKEEKEQVYMALGAIDTLIDMQYAREEKK